VAGLGLSFTQRIRQEHLDCVALVSAVAASIGVEIAAYFERIELCVGDTNGSAPDTVPAALAIGRAPGLAIRCNVLHRPLV